MIHRTLLVNQKKQAELIKTTIEIIIERGQDVFIYIDDKFI